MPGKKELSLLPDEVNTNTPLARLLYWLTTVGRYIIVFTELIVICAFISRFWLDRKNADLSEIVRQQKAILASTTDFETEYTSLQSRLKFIGDFYRHQPSYPAAVQSLISSTPGGIFYQTLNFGKIEDKPDQLTASINLYTYQEDAIVDFITNLSLNPDIASVDVKKIEKKAKDNKYYVDISLIFKTHGQPSSQPQS